MKIIYPLLLLCISAFGFSQAVTHGPIVGGVTDTSCRVFLRTDVSTAFTVELSVSNSFTAIAASASGTTDPNKDNTAIVELDGLISNKKYYARIKIGGNQSGGLAQFETFYAQGSTAHQVFLTGANISTLTDADSAIFVKAKAESAKAFIEVGNWGYPDANACFDVYYISPPTSWAKTYSNVQNLYKQRYTSSNSGTFIQSLALDYVYDDHDYMNQWAGSGEILGTYLNITGAIFSQAYQWTQPAQARLNSIQGYRQLFPGYNLHDTTEGVYHSFRSGNAEFFVLDVRSMRGPNLLHVDTVGSVNNWQYLPLPGNPMLGTNQMAWLQNALSNSTATWKFIVTSVPFNTGNRFALDTLIKLGSANVPYWNPSVPCYPLPLLKAAVASTNNFADMWAGYKADADTVMNYIFSNNIKNVFVLSGHSGTVGLDDGVNAGLPELMCANMKQSNSQDALLLQNFMGYSVWDLGGSGLCGQSNFNTSYGRVEIFNDDSIRLSAVDPTGAEVTGFNFYANSAYLYNPNYAASRLPMAINDFDSVQEGGTVAIPVLANDVNPNHDSLYANILSNPAHGSAVLNANNTISYTPTAGYFGTDSFRYTGCNRLNAQCQNCSQATVVVIVLQVTGVIELAKDILLKVYPNPAENMLTAEITNSKGEFEIVLMNALGEQLLSRNFTEKVMIDISRLAAGNYYYDLKSKVDGTSSKGKVCVSR